MLIRKGSARIALHCKTDIPRRAISAIQVPSISDTDIIFVKQLNESYLVGNRHNRFRARQDGFVSVVPSPSRRSCATHPSTGTDVCG